MSLTDLLPADSSTITLLGLIAAVLTIAAAAAGMLLLLARRRTHLQPLARDVAVRTATWWAMAAILILAILLGATVTVVLFALISFLALREFITIAPTGRGDHRVLFWAFFVVVPLQYVFIAVQWTAMAMIFIPVYCFLFLPIRAAATDSTDNFLARTAIIQWGLMVCVYALSHVPALLTLPLATGSEGAVRLVLVLALVVQGCDVMQYVWGKTCGRRRILPTVSPNKTWAGLLGGLASAAAIAAGLAWAIPFTPWQAAGIGALLGLLGFGGDVVLSAIKRDAGIKDYGHCLPGHGGVLDRVDSLCFAAPVFFHLVRYYAT